MKLEHHDNVVYGQMKTRQIGEWHVNTRSEENCIQKKRQLRNITISAAAVFCLGIGAMNLASDGKKAAQVMSHITADFEYDETLGRLQFVSNILPDSALEFLNQNTEEAVTVFAPTKASITHAWNQEEPWLEYEHNGVVSACSAGEVMTIIKNRDDAYTVRVLHEAGYESVYSGLSEVAVAAFDSVIAGEEIGRCTGELAFEMRKDGLSIKPEFELAGDA